MFEVVISGIPTRELADLLANWFRESKPPKNIKILVLEVETISPGGEPRLAADQPKEAN
jgi:hypothetical protein